MSVFGLIGKIFEPAAKLVDELHTSEEEKLKLKTKQQEIQNEITGRLLDLESQRLEAQQKIINAEATGQSWIQRNWRPITMLTFLVLVVMDSFGWLANPLAPEAWLLLQIGLGGYVAGRSAEKIAPLIKSQK